jgi:prepilin-type N-terminal cleavage/methylation domain-containing protein
MFTSPESRRAFTLLEVMMGLAILAILTGSIYGVLRGTLEMAAGMDEARLRQQQIDGLFELCRKTFRMMPTHAVWEGRLRKQDGKVYPEMIIRKAPEILAWDKVTDFETVSVLGLRPQIGGLNSLSLLRVSQQGDRLIDPVTSAKPGDWMPLVTDLSKLEWRYFDPRSNLWLDELPAGALRPSAVELKLWFPGEVEPLIAVFWVVPMMNQVTVPLEKVEPLP